MSDRRDDGTAQLRREIGLQRDGLVQAVGTLRMSATAPALRRVVEHRRPILLAGAVLGGFVLSGGLGAVVRLAFRRRHNARERLRIGRFAIVER